MKHGSCFVDFLLMVFAIIDFMAKEFIDIGVDSSTIHNAVSKIDESSSNSDFSSLLSFTTIILGKGINHFFWSF